MVAFAIVARDNLTSLTGRKIYHRRSQALFYLSSTFGEKEMSRQVMIMLIVSIATVARKRAEKVSATFFILFLLMRMFALLK